MLKSKVTEIGELVPAFEEEKLMILFGPTATKELRSISVIHEFQGVPSKELLKVGGKIQLGGNEYTVTKVGDTANKNFEELGHVSIYFRTGENEILPGAILVEPEAFPVVEAGEEITFL